MSGNDDSTLSKPTSLALRGVTLFNVIVDIVLAIGTERDFEVTITPTNTQATPIKISQSRVWFGLSAGKFFSIDLDDLEGGMDGSYASAVSLVRCIIQNGMYESGVIDEGKCVEWECIIPTENAQLEFSYQESRLFKKKPAKSNRQDYKYQPYSKSS